MSGGQERKWRQRKRTKAVESRDEGMAMAAFPLQPFSSMMQDSLHSLPYTIKIPVQVGFYKKHISDNPQREKKDALVNGQGRPTWLPLGIGRSITS